MSNDNRVAFTVGYIRSELEKLSHIDFDPESHKERVYEAYKGLVAKMNPHLVYEFALIPSEDPYKLNMTATPIAVIVDGKEVPIKTFIATIPALAPQTEAP